MDSQPSKILIIYEWGIRVKQKVIDILMKAVKAVNYFGSGDGHFGFYRTKPVLLKFSGFLLMVSVRKL